MRNPKTIGLISGETYKDKRGKLKFFNAFNFLNVKRFYEVSNSKKNPIRAFHGHIKEEKFVYPVKGKTLLCVVKINKTINPSKKALVKKFILSEENPIIVHIPAGYANGFKTLTNGARIIFFSTSTLSSSQKDDFRFPYDYWGKKIWEI